MGCLKRGKTVPARNAAAPRANTLVDGAFINASGSWSLTEGRFTWILDIEVRAPDVSGSLTTHEDIRGGRLGSELQGLSFPPFSPGSPWFIYIESQRRIWYYDGKSTLVYHVWGLSDSDTVIREGELRPGQPPVPTDIIRRLPAELQKLLPPLPAPGGRPSI